MPFQIDREALSFDDILLVPNFSNIKSRKDVDISSEVVPGLKIDIPIISANMKSVTGPKLAQTLYENGAIGALHRFNSIDEALRDYLQLTSSSMTPNEALVSIGVKEDLWRFEALLAAGAKYFIIDVAHADHHQVYKLLCQIERNFSKSEINIVVGNFATMSAVAEFLFEFEIVKAVKIGIGPGAACSTREVTGFGYPQLTAIQEAKEAVAISRRDDVRIIADGGIRTSGDIVKALAFGADTVMIGRLFAGCPESLTPGTYFGNASQTINGHNAPEGAHAEVGISESAVDVLKRLAWGIKSGFSYVGARNLKEFQAHVGYIKVSESVKEESRVRI